MRKFSTLLIRVPPLRSVALACASLGFSMAAWPIDLLQAYDAAREQDATILAARATAEAGRERLPQAWAQLLPNVSASAVAKQNQLASVIPNFAGLEQLTNSNYGSSNQTLTARQPLFRPQQMAQYRQAKAQVDGTDATLAQDEQDLAVRVSSAYFEAMLTDEQLTLVLAQRAAYTTQLDAARKSFAAGAGTRTDVDDTQARLDMTLALEIEARQNIDYTFRQLQILVNQPVDKLARLNVSRLELLDPQPNRLDDWTARAENSSPYLQSLKAQIEAARQEVERARAGHYPTLDAVAQYSRSTAENVQNIRSRYSNTSIGVELNVPIFAGGYVNSLVRQSLAGLERAEQSYEAGRRELGARVHKEFRAMTENIPKIRALEQAVRSADQVVLSNRKSFQAGSRTMVDVLNGEHQRLMAMRDLMQARYMYLMSKVRLLALVGAADRDALATINQTLLH